MNVIEVEQLVKSYNSVKAVDGVTFNVTEGETFGFLGPNGAGKTSTINILCTLLGFDSGNAQVNGYDCVKESLKVRSSIGLVFQEVTLDNELTAHENLKFHCYMYNMSKRLANERIDEILEVVGLEDKRSTAVKKFSGGMKRRLEIARGLLHRPKVLFLDEPTLGLDPQTRSNVWEFISTLKGSLGTTVFMTTHYMDEAEVCDRIAIIDAGKIIACESPGSLKSSLRGDTVYIKTSDDGRACVELHEKFNLSARKIGSGLSIIVEAGEKFIPKIFESLETPVLSVSMKRPSLEDVFINLTGKEIREAQPAAQRSPRR